MCGRHFRLPLFASLGRLENPVEKNGQADFLCGTMKMPVPHGRGEVSSMNLVYEILRAVLVDLIASQVSKWLDR